MKLPWPSALGFVGVALLVCFCMSGCGEEGKAQKTPRADLISIETLAQFGPLQEPAVLFLHDLHTKTLIEEKDMECKACHLPMDKEKKLLSLKFERLEDKDGQEILTIYHEKCLGCHLDVAASGSKAGPITCGECHKIDPEVFSSRVPLAFDNSLHYRHVKAAEKKCELCHHEYNAETKKLYYDKGKERSCRDCHREKTEENRESMRLVSHRGCIDCHQKKLAEKKDTDAGPIKCEGCHDSTKQLAIKKVEEVPRMERNQPDVSLIRPAALDLESSKMNTVPFDHKTHEEAASTCRICHHETLKPCKECHTLQGDEEGKEVTLERSMHETGSQHSCMGCHRTKMRDATCAGCHSRITLGPLPKSTCQRCHAGPRPDDPVIEQTPAEQYEKFMPVVMETKLSFSEEDIPKEIIIKRLAEEYEPAKFPHLRIYKKLRESIKDNRLAKGFHSHDDVLCLGCHHKSPVGTKPALCGSCHARPSEREGKFMPKLEAAYHLQCLNCHTKMAIGPIGCTECHKKKGEGGPGPSTEAAVVPGSRMAAQSPLGPTKK